MIRSLRLEKNLQSGNSILDRFQRRGRSCRRCLDLGATTKHTTPTAIFARTSSTITTRKWNPSCCRRKLIFNVHYIGIEKRYLYRAWKAAIHIKESQTQRKLDYINSPAHCCITQPPWRPLVIAKESYRKIRKPSTFAIRQAAARLSPSGCTAFQTPPIVW